MSAASVKQYADRNWDGFYSSPEYINFAKSIGQSSDKSVYKSPYFGDLTGQIFGNSIDEAFMSFQERIQNPEMFTEPSIDSGGKLSGMHIILLAAAAFYFLG